MDRIFSAWEEERKGEFSKAVLPLPLIDLPFGSISGGGALFVHKGGFEKFLHLEAPYFCYTSSNTF